ncbi:radical SAM family heme chaperone HemW, partial [bacterium]
MRHATSGDVGADSLMVFPPFFSLYIHVPFCRSLCPYCHFYRIPPRPGDEERYLKALLIEASTLGLEAPGPVRTIYFGGGTPSLLSSFFYVELFANLRELFDLEYLIETTLEVDARITKDELLGLANAGFDRVSIGIKSFQKESLIKLGVQHDSERSLEAIEWARASGFSSVGIDLLYGFEGQEIRDFISDVEIGLAVKPDHISLYALQECPEQGPRESDPDIAAQMFRESRRVLIADGYSQYEICNFAKPGHISLHNINYWMDGDYFGLGPSSHSALTLDGSRRRWANRDDLDGYLKDPVKVREELSVEDSKKSPAEALILALRLAEGVDIERFILRHGVDPRKL